MIEEFIKYRTQLWLHIYYKTNKDRTLTEDLVQDLFLKLHHIDDIGKYEDRGKFLSWCKRVATNLVMDHYRKESRSKVDLIEDRMNMLSDHSQAGFGFPDPWNSKRFGVIDEEYEDTFVTDEMREQLMDALANLPEKARELLISRYFRNMTYNEIVLESGETLSNLLPRHHYTIKKLRKEFGYD